MIHCITQDIENYSCNMRMGLRLGIGMLAKDNPAMFSIISLMSPILYQWEAGSPVPQEERAHKLSPYLERLYAQTLLSLVGGNTVKHWLATLDDPVQVYCLISRMNLETLPLLSYYDIDQLKLVMRARCRSWIIANLKAAHYPMLTVFTEQEEEEVKDNAYGSY